MNENPAGWEVTLHKSLTEPILIAGLPRSQWTAWSIVTAVLAFGLREFWILPISAVLYVGLVLATKHDPYFLEVVLSALKNPKRLEP